MITILGGVYDEYCFEPNWKQKFGSGLRACWTIHTLSPSTPIQFHTFCDNSTLEYLKLLNFLEVQPTLIEHTCRFYYDHPLINPSITPRLDTLNRNSNRLSADGTNILYYGFFEGFATVKGDKVVYDPQSPIMPIPFSATNSTASELAYLINMQEAMLISKKTAIPEIKKFFFEVEKASILVIKMGAKGALIATKDGQETTIPVYKTPYVWPIGSGDVFAAVFAFLWFQNEDAIQAAKEASWQTACYCNSRNFLFSPIGSVAELKPLAIQNYPKGQVYLAGPFFTFAERWLIDQLRTCLKNIGLKVFSPWHDVGYGIASEVVSKDLLALDNSSIIFAVLDGLDSGTLFEIGYAIKLDIPVVGYVENETLESVKMLEGTNCILEKDMTTAIYKCFWTLTEKENV